jgi:hypothetical protein
MHRYGNESSGVGRFGALIISLICGVLCFLGIIYFMKYRRQGYVDIPYLGTFGGNSNNMPPPHVNAAPPNNYPQYPNDPYGSNPYHQQPQQGYNPNYPGYPPL